MSVTEKKNVLTPPLGNYQPDDFYDELFQSDGSVRSFAEPLARQVNTLTIPQLAKRQKAAELSLFQQGITFGVYGDRRGTEKVFPFDVLPRIVSADEWKQIEAGLEQRIQALNLFLGDIYNAQSIIKDGIIPNWVIDSSPSYVPQCKGLKPPHNIWVHITGTDLVRDNDGSYYVLEDNLRCPSGISYVLQNRIILKDIFPAAFPEMRVRPVSPYTDRLYETLKFAGSTISSRPNIVVLTPGVYNSAYFEHSYLAQQMGVPLVEGCDLEVVDDHLMLRTTRGLEKVDVVYRRIDDAFLDPREFNPDSILGVPGLMQCFRKGNVALANAPGSGIADDKAVYAYVPDMIKYYLDQDPIIKNVPTYLCSVDQQRQHVLQNLDQLVVKRTNGSGGYGMLIGSVSTEKQRTEFAEKIRNEPHSYIAQPTLSLSRCPTIVGGKIEGRHVDFRPYSLFGSSLYTLPGGLTRVALVKDSLVVNSSQGGGSKDTWVLDPELTSEQGEQGNA